LLAFVAAAGQIRAETGVTGFVDQYGAQHFSYVDTNGHIQEIVFNGSTVAPPLDVTASTPGAVAVESNTGFASFGTSVDQHWVFLGTNGHVYQIVYNPGAGRLGQLDMTALSGTSILGVARGGVTGFVDASGAQHFSFIDSNQHIQDIVYNGSAAAPPVDVTAASSAGAVRTGTPLGSFATSYDQHWIFLGINGHLYQIIALLNLASST
jgi:hypothetical protein